MPLATDCKRSVNDGVQWIGLFQLALRVAGDGKLTHLPSPAKPLTAENLLRPGSPGTSTLSDSPERLLSVTQTEIADIHLTGAQ